MFSLEIDCDTDDRDLLIAEARERGCAGIVELPAGAVRAFFEDSTDRRPLLAMFPGSRERTEEERDWVQAARDLLQPMEVGRRFFLVPEWRDDPTPAGRLRIAVNPGMAFGTGVHETTRLCLEAMEHWVQPGMTVLDIGTGQGILARAARLLGAARVIACDTDPVAVGIAGEGFVGSVDAVKTAAVDLVVANISAEAIMLLAPDLRRVRRGGGILLASGFEVHEVDAVGNALGAGEVRTKGSWALIAIT